MTTALLIFATTFFAILKIILTAFGGYALAKRGLFHKQVTRDMGKVIFSFMVPCLIFGNILKNVDIEKAKMVGLLFLFPVLTHILAFSLGNISSRLLGYKSEEEEYLLVVAGSTFGNHGNIAVPLVAAIVGDPKGPFSHLPDASGESTAYVMVYMSMSSVIIWGVGMPWFKRRNQQKLAREKAKSVELQRVDSEKSVENEPNAGKEPNMEKDQNVGQGQNVGSSIVVAEAKKETENHDAHDHHHDHLTRDSTKVSLLQAEDEAGVEHAGAGAPRTGISLKGQVLKLVFAVRKSYFFEVLTLPPVAALTSALFVSFIPPLRTFLMTTYAQVIPNTVAFIGDASIPIILMFLGSNLADTSIDAHVPRRIMVSVVVTRLVLLPAVGISATYLAIRLGLLPNNIILQFIILMQFSMPSAVNLILACQIAGGGEAKMSNLLFWQYIFCSFTISTFCIIVQFILL
eukprot:Phypoly_transcript_08405.p1 GENE.Phypoly_transcript_08405~~Phypoly_transcript_08405.p1  ORF type:complete len:486 (+),score=70.02 Phypoly_transcript_08405:83-1459(+)